MGFIPNEIDEDMEDFNDFDDNIDTELDHESAPDRPPSPLAWRKVLIEKAVAKVKKAKGLKLDTSVSHTKGSLLFDKDSNKFARVLESKPGFINLSFISGGNIIKQDFSPLDFIKQNRQNMTLLQMAQELKINETQVVQLLNKIELESEKSSIKFDDLKPQKKVVTKIKAKAFISKDAALKMAKKPFKLVSEQKTEIKANPVAETFFQNILPKGATTDPIMDPNGYIKQTFMLMSNKQLAVATGLSEHTIRRKLGEWGLKRKS